MNTPGFQLSLPASFSSLLSLYVVPGERCLGFRGLEIGFYYSFSQWLCGDYQGEKGVKTSLLSYFKTKNLYSLLIFPFFLLLN